MGPMERTWSLAPGIFQCRVCVSGLFVCWVHLIPVLLFLCVGLIPVLGVSECGFDTRSGCL